MAAGTSPSINDAGTVAFQGINGSLLKVTVRNRDYS